MKMIIRMFCAAALVVGALSLTGCGEKKADATGTNAVTNATDKAKDAAKKGVDAAADKAGKAVDKATK